MGGMNADAKKARAVARTVGTVEEFSRWAEERKGRLLLYRGLADVKWKGESAAYRRIKGAESDPEIPGVFKNYISQLLDTARMRGFGTHEGRVLPDLELLARLQHFGAATCLIDFTRNPLVALWFACHGQLEQDGKVVAMDTTGTDTTPSSLDEESKLRSIFRIVTSEQINNKIQNFLDGKTLWKWEPTLQASRVIAQQSIFVFGKEMIEDGRYEAVCVPASEKESILRTLREKFGINQARLFGDFIGFVLANAHDKPYEEYSADDYFEFAESFFQRGSKEKAIQLCSKAIEEDSRHFNAYHLRGRCNILLKNWQDSVDDFSQAIAINKKHTRSLLLRGQVYERELQQPKQAIADYNKVIELASNSMNKIPQDQVVIATIYLSRALALLKTP